MDIDALAKGVGLFATALCALRQAISLLPDDSRKAEAQAALDGAEQQFRLAQAEAATKLDYEICRNHFPPEVMLSKDDMNWVCQKCGNKKDTGPYIAHF
jgi:hypothetical protein